MPFSSDGVNRARPVQMVGGEGFEPSHLAIHGPEPCASASSATRPPFVRGKSANLPRTEHCSGAGFRHPRIHIPFLKFCNGMNRTRLLISSLRQRKQ